MSKTLPLITRMTLICADWNKRIHRGGAETRRKRSRSAANERVSGTPYRWWRWSHWFPLIRERELEKHKKEGAVRRDC